MWCIAPWPACSAEGGPVPAGSHAPVWADTMQSGGGLAGFFQHLTQPVFDNLMHCKCLFIFGLCDHIFEILLLLRLINVSVVIITFKKLSE